MGLAFKGGFFPVYPRDGTERGSKIAVLILTWGFRDLAPFHPGSPVPAVVMPPANPCPKPCPSFYNPCGGGSKVPGRRIVRFELGLMAVTTRGTRPAGRPPNFHVLIGSPL